MKHYVDVEIPAKISKRLVKTTCDICTKKIEEELYTVDEVTIEYKTGSSYPEGGSGDEIGVDMCGKCFNNKLIPWLKEQGANPTTREWDW